MRIWHCDHENLHCRSAGEQQAVAVPGRVTQGLVLA